MLKRITTSFLYYGQEMLTALMLLAIYRMYSSDSIAVWGWHDMSWLVFVLCVVMAVMNLPRLWPYAALVVILLGLFLWGYHLLHVVFWLIYPLWRLMTIIQLPLKGDQLTKRFSFFTFFLVVGLILASHHFEGQQHTWMYSVIVPQLLLLVLGLLYINFIHTIEETGGTVWEWCKRQGVLVYVVIAGVIGTGLLFLLFDPLRQMLIQIPRLLYQLVMNMPYLFEWMSHLPIKETEAPEAEEYNVTFDLERWNEKQTASDGSGLESVFFTVIGIVSVAFLGLIIAVLVMYLYRLVQHGVIAPHSPTDAIEGKKYKWAQKVNSQNVMQKRKTLRRADDNIRRHFQSLWLYTLKKGGQIPLHWTARDWAKKYNPDTTNEDAQLFSSIVDIYERQRYGPMSNETETVQKFIKNVKLAKKALRQDFKRKKNREDNHGG
ncbi:hypothetical protein [Caldalkalibacillus salinus]|uniref:hypothetical protein n=1 Tax=Caldalkalibacillus salinus TaxID=2803787 RepID=UPI0019210121|nr:hypothetical protein [Caldalkalibacillus salinus]